jgi:hypothetical protein
MGAVEPIDDHTCLFHIGAESPETAAWFVAILGIDFTVTEPPEILTALTTFATRCSNAIRN